MPMLELHPCAWCLHSHPNTCYCYCVYINPQTCAFVYIYHCMPRLSLANFTMCYCYCFTLKNWKGPVSYVGLEIITLTLATTNHVLATCTCRHSPFTQHLGALVTISYILECTQLTHPTQMPSFQLV